MKNLPPSSRYRCLHGILKPKFIWSVEAGKPVLLTDEAPNPNCSICSGPLRADRKAPRQDSPAIESIDAEMSEAVSA
jgi:hypothetical protein